MDQVEARFRDLHTLTYEGSTLASLWCIFLVSVGVLIFNSFLITLFATDRTLRTPAAYLVLNLSVIEFCLGLTNTIMYGINLYHKRWALGTTAAHIQGCLLVGFCSASLTSLGLLGIERWLVIVKQKRLELRQSIGLIIGTWTWSTILASSPYWFGNKWVLEASLLYHAGDYANRSAAGIFVTMLIFMNVSLPLMTFMFSYAQIYKVIKDWNAHERQSSLGRQQTANNRLEAMLMRKVLIVVGVFVFNWVLQDVSFMFELITGKQDQPIVETLAAIFCVFNSCVNPILFIVLDARFSAAARRLLRLPPSSSSSPSTSMDNRSFQSGSFSHTNSWALQKSTLSGSGASLRPTTGDTWADEKIQGSVSPSPSPLRYPSHISHSPPQHQHQHLFQHEHDQFQQQDRAVPGFHSPRGKVTTFVLQPPYA